MNKSAYCALGLEASWLRLCFKVVEEAARQAPMSGANRARRCMTGFIRMRLRSENERFHRVATQEGTRLVRGAVAARGPWVFAGPSSPARRPAGPRHRVASGGCVISDCGALTGPRHRGHFSIAGAHHGHE
jgi:hypothetical protein